jgi:phospholipid-binding lipoprotein MlaA
VRNPWLAVLPLALALSSASPPPAAADEPDPLRRITAEEAAETPGIFDAHDPLEGLNRRIYVFNARFDDHLFLPAVNMYETVLPGFVRTGISNLRATLDDTFTFANSVLQLKPKKASLTVGRVMVNLTMGVAGLYDAATRLGMPRYDEDFGQTLGHYGMPPGPFLVVPILGPSSLRDGTGDLVEAVPLMALGIPPWWLTPVVAVSARSDNPFRYGDIGPPFEYDIVRFLYLEYRRFLVEN